MTMFSMKPKFDLAEFLAVPAPPGAARSGGGRRRMQFQPSAPAQEATKPTTAEETGTEE